MMGRLTRAPWDQLPPLQWVPIHTVLGIDARSSSLLEVFPSFKGGGGQLNSESGMMSGEGERALEGMLGDGLMLEGRLRSSGSSIHMQVL